MAWSFGDSFDLYATLNDMINGYWDSAAGFSGFSLTTGRFPGSQAVSMAPSSQMRLTKSSGANDAVHHFVCAFKTTATLSGTTLGFIITLYDGATAQCTICFRQDGAILLKSGSPIGSSDGSGVATLATYSGAVTANNTWYAFEFEVVVGNTAGSFAVRKNGNTVNDFSATSLNTRVSANNYANKVAIDSNWGTTTNIVDDFFWRSDASSVAWMGDIRCYTRMPASDQSVTFSRLPTNFFAQAATASGGSSSLLANTIRFISLNAPTTGIVASLVFNLNSAMTGHAKMALYDATGASSGPGALIASTVELTNPGLGLTAFAIASGPTVQRGVTYWIALWSDATIVSNTNTPTNPYQQLNLTYATSFPSSAAGFSLGGNTWMNCAGMNVTPFNSGEVNDPQQDSLASYVYDSNPGDTDFYGIGSIASTPAAVIATTVRALAQKSDSGSRTLAVQLKSGATTVTTPTLVLTTSSFQWAWRTDTTDPNTGAAWNPVAVNNAQIGPKVVA